MRYILTEGGTPAPEPDLHKWATWFETADAQRQVKLDEINGVRVSTVFLGLDHDFRHTGKPVLWETMTFSANSNLSGLQERCAGSKADALAMHERMVQQLKELL